MSEFSITSNPPGPVRAGRGRPSNNPYRKALVQSLEEDYKSQDIWVEVQVSPDEVKKTCDKIRSSGQLKPKIGTEIRKSDSDGIIAFRGVEHKARNRKAYGPVVVEHDDSEVY